MDRDDFLHAVLPVIIALLVFVSIAIMAFGHEDKRNSIEVRAVCTVESGVIVTVSHNSRIAGDAVSAVRMTEAEYLFYCVEGNQ